MPILWIRWWYQGTGDPEGGASYRPFALVGRKEGEAMGIKHAGAEALIFLLHSACK